MKLENIEAMKIWAFIIVGLLAFWGGLGYSIYLNFAKQKEINNLNTQMEWTVKQYNKINHEKNDLEKSMPLKGTCLERIPAWEVTL